MHRTTVLLFLALPALAAETGSRWTGFRGNGDSLSEASKLPLAWAHDRNVAWKIDVPGIGQSTPVVYDGRVFLTSVEGPKKEKLNVFALDLKSGKMLWHKQMATSRPHPMGDRVARAAPTPAVEPGRLYALFDSGDLFAFSHGGELLWKVDFNSRFGEIQPGHDFGSSLRLHGGRLFAHVSQAKPSYLVSVRTGDGSTDWKIEMPQEGGYGTPILVRQEGRDLLLVSSQGGVIAYDPETGRELWKNVKPGGRGGIPSLTAARGIVVAASMDKKQSFALKLDQPGQSAWVPANAATQYSSPLIHRDRVYFVNAVGVLFSVDLASGREVWNTRLPGPAWASAIAAQDRLYFFTTEGITVVFQAGGDAPQKLAESQLPVASTVYAVTPVDGALLVRTGTELWKVADVGPVSSFATPETLVTAAKPVEPAPQPPSGAKPGDVWVHPRDGQEYVLVPAGEFTMGCPAGKCVVEEAPEKPASVPAPFWLGRTEVTVAAFRKFAAATGGRLPEEPKLLDRSLNPRWQQAGLPVVNLYWSQANAYCGWVGGRLPTETEFEYAARAGGDGYPSADTAWSAENSGEKPLGPEAFRNPRAVDEALYANRNTLHPVATRKPNTFGIYDLLGNAAEWSAGLINDLPPVIRGGPPVPPEVPFRASRGGSFAGPAQQTRATSRQRHTLDGRNENLGFRCVLDVAK